MSFDHNFVAIWLNKIELFYKYSKLQKTNQKVKVHLYIQLHSVLRLFYKYIYGKNQLDIPIHYAVFAAWNLPKIH